MKNSTLCLSVFFVLNGFSMAALAQRTATVETYQENGISFKKLSDNGEWAIGHRKGYSAYERATIWNIKENTFQVITMVDEANSELSQQCTMADISDQGWAVGSIDGDFSTSLPAVYKDGAWVKLTLPEGCIAGAAEYISADGSLIAGYVHKQSSTGTTKVELAIWRNGEPEIIESPADRMGQFKGPNKIIGLDEAGEKIIAHLAWNTPMNGAPAIYNNEEWTVLDGEKKHIYMHPVASHDGRWVTGMCMYNTGTGIVETPYIYDTEAKETILDIANNENGIGTCIGSDQTMFVCVPYRSPIRQAYLKFPDVKTNYPMVDYLKEHYGFNIESVGYSTFGTVVDISKDCKTIIGIQSAGKNWCLKLSEPLQTVALGLEQKQQESSLKVRVEGNVLHFTENVAGVEIYTIGGALVEAKTQIMSQIAVNNLSAGMYVVVMKDVEGNVKMEKVVF